MIFIEEIWKRQHKLCPLTLKHSQTPCPSFKKKYILSYRGFLKFLQDVIEQIIILFLVAFSIKKYICSKLNDSIEAKAQETCIFI